ncbi:MAG TPA: sulfatase [Candidatus Binatia bacterium]|nr:sulfatase [Candidatus Binatia bacterium]
MSRVRAVGAGIAGGLLAGAIVGAAEAIGVWLHAHGTGELPSIPWALIAYGLVGGAFGLGAGVLAALVGADGFGLAFAGVGAALAVVVARFRIVRDVFLEQMPHGPLPLLVQLIALASVALLAYGVWRALRGADARRRTLTRPLVAAVVVAALALGWSALARMRPPPPSPPAVARAAAPAGAPNVLLLMIDTLRADHLSCYGGTAVSTPHIDTLATGGLRYANMFSQASWTRPSVATILTGLYPSSHGAVHKADRLPDRVDTLAEMLQRAGYRTIGFANNANVSQAFNFQQGFDEYRYLAPDFFFRADEPASQLTLYSGLRLVRERFLSHYVDVHHYYQPAEVVTAEVRRWLDGRRDDGRPFFLFVHYMDAHDPYFAHPFNGEGYARVAHPNPDPALAEKLHQLYASGIGYLDEHLGVLFEDLHRRGLWDNTLVLLTGDHGEEFHEHGGWWHGTTLYDEQIHVPLLVKPPGTHAGRVIDEFATSLDITPTILAAAGASVPPSLPGHVLPLDGGAPPSRQSVFAEEDLEGNVLQAVRTREWKIVNANPGNPRGLAPEELYDLGGDPGEHQNAVSSAPAAAQTMRAELGRSVVEARANAGTTEKAGPAGDAQRERLRALGYVE